ncbi:MAG: hypothetical protein WA672_02600 [Candidatus Angelobacter sp.]
MKSSVQRLNMTDGVKRWTVPDTDGVKVLVVCGCNFLVNVKSKLRV